MTRRAGRRGKGDDLSPSVPQPLPHPVPGVKASAGKGTRPGPMARASADTRSPLTAAAGRRMLPNPAGHPARRDFRHPEHAEAHAADGAGRKAHMRTDPVEHMRKDAPAGAQDAPGAEDGRMTPEAAWRMLLDRGVPPRGLGHARAVGRVAEALAGALSRARAASGIAPDLSSELALIAGLVHDIGKRESHVEDHHEATGALLLRDMGLIRVAEIVAAHRDCLPDTVERLSEKELVYLADKYCHGGRFTPLEIRFERKIAHNADNPARCAAIRRRREHARAVAARFAAEAGADPEILARETLEFLPPPAEDPLLRFLP